MKKLRKTYSIEAPLSRVWQALIDPKDIDAWGAGPAIMDATSGSMFSLWGGEINGTNVEVEKEKKLVQEWYAGAWVKPSHVTIRLSAKGSTTTITLEHTEIPDSEYDSIKGGWDDYYFGAIKKHLEKK